MEHGWTVGQDIEKPQETEGPSIRGRSLCLGTGSLLLAAVEAICLFLVSASALSVGLGGSAIVLAPAVFFFHSSAIRLPILAIASAIAALNLLLLSNQWRLRRAPSAQWRIRPLTLKERRRIVLITVTSALTLILVAVELYLHHKLHGSAFADSFIQPIRAEIDNFPA